MLEAKLKNKKKVKRGHKEGKRMLEAKLKNKKKVKRGHKEGKEGLNS